MFKSSASKRRTFLKTIGAVSTASVLPFSGTATAESETIDDSFDMMTDAVQEALVVFETNDDVDRLATLDLESGYHKFEVLSVGYAELTTDQIRTVADWSEVTYVRKNVELDYHNNDARSTTRANSVQTDLGYTGSSVHAAVIDSGVDGDHPDLNANLVANWRYLNPLTNDAMWVRAGDVDTDDNGHGTHTSGSVAGDGTKSDGEYRGMAPDADLTVYSAGLTLFILQAVGAFDHMVARKLDGKTDVQVVSNSYGSSTGEDFDPGLPLNLATWEAYQAGILPVFSAGNSGPGTNTLNDYAKAPHVLGVAATHDDKQVTDFSSRGRTPSYDGETNYDRKTALDNLAEYYETMGKPDKDTAYGIYRNGVGAPGSYVMSTLAPTDPLQGYAAGTEHQDTKTWYGRISGTSMSCPVTAGAATLVIDAYQQNNGGTASPIDVLNTVEAEAEDVHEGYTPANIGAGFVDAYDAVTRAESGDLATFDDVNLVN